MEALLNARRKWIGAEAESGRSAVRVRVVKGYFGINVLHKVRGI